MSASAHNRARVSIAIGTLTMVFGALLAFAPEAAASGHKLDICHRTESVKKAYTQISVNISSTDGSLGNGNGQGQDHTGHTDDIIPEYTFGDIVFPGQNWTPENEIIWANDCAVSTDTTPEATLTLVKEVTGDVPAGGWSFDFSVTGEDDVTLTDASDSEELTVTPGDYDIVELDDGDAAFVSFECTDDNDVEADPVDVSDDADDPAAAVELADGDAVTCTFVNDFLEAAEEAATLTVVKEVTGDVPAGGWSFDFSVTGEDDVTLTDASDSEELTVTPGDYDIVELDDGDAAFVSFECTDDNDVEADPVDVSDDADDPAAAVELADGDSVTCTFVNDFPVSGGPSIVPTVTPPGLPSVTPPVVVPTPPVLETPPVIDIGEAEVIEVEVVEVEAVSDEEVAEEAVEEDEEVLGESVVRTLPRTGDESGLLATIGFALVLLGAMLAVVSRRKQRILR